MLAFRLRLSFHLCWLAIGIAAACCWQLQAEATGQQHKAKLRRDHQSHKSDSKRNKVLKKAIGRLLRSGVHYYSPEALRHFKYLLSSISIPRSVNSKGHRHVRKFIKTTIGSLSPNWHVEEDSFATEAAGSQGGGEGNKVRFRNIVATYIPSSYLCSGINQYSPVNQSESDHHRRPPAQSEPQQQQRIVLSCHYDSLHPSLVHGGGGGGGGDYSRNGRGSISRSRGGGGSGRQFVGATDAAVSCSILLSLAQYITPYLALVTKHQKPKHHNAKPPPTLQLIFFDGEEALLDDRSTSKRHDSNFHHQIGRSLRSSASSSSSNSRNALYGSRHLAQEWEQAAAAAAASLQNSTSLEPKKGGQRSTKKRKKKKRSRQLLSTEAAATSSSIFKSAARLAATADQLCKLSSSSAAANNRGNQPQYDNYRSTRSTKEDRVDDGGGGGDDVDEANEIVPRDDEDDAAVGGDDEVIDAAVVSLSARRHRLAVVTDLESNGNSNDDDDGDEGKNHRSVQSIAGGGDGGRDIDQLALTESARRLLVGNYHSLANIRLLLLLDLIGGPQAPRFFNTNLLTNRYFRQLAEIEKHLLASTSNKSKFEQEEKDDSSSKSRSQKKKSFRKPFFQTSPPFVLSLVRDDHLPFVVRNVPVVHLIPTPFPRNWHTAEDNLRSLNFDAIGRITRVLQIFLLHSLKV